MSRAFASRERDIRVGAPDDALRRLGTTLREARLARGQELQDAAHWLRIKPSFLIALEEGDLAAMPGRVYAKGFLRSYGDHLGLDGAVLSARLDEALGTVSGRRDLQHPAPTRRYQPDATAVVAALMLGAVGAGAYLLVGARGNLPPRSVADQAYADGASARASEAVPLTALVSADAELGLRAPPTASVAGRVILVGRRPGWVRLTDSTGDFVRSWAVGPGDWIPVPPHRGLALSTSDAGSVEILVDGRSVSTAGPDATVLRGLPLDPESLLARMPAS
jgi:hypothetical protein